VVYLKQRRNPPRQHASWHYLQHTAPLSRKSLSDDGYEYTLYSYNLTSGSASLVEGVNYLAAAVHTAKGYGVAFDMRSRQY